MLRLFASQKLRMKGLIWVNFLGFTMSEAITLRLFVFLSIVKLYLQTLEVAQYKSEDIIIATKIITLLKANIRKQINLRRQLQ